METGHTTMTVTWKESVCSVDYGDMERGSQPPLQSLTQAPSSALGPTGLWGLLLSPCHSS